MNDDQTPIAEELETAIEAEEPVDVNALEAAETEATETEPTAQEEPAEELETIELDGKQYQIPAALKGGFLMQQDYTRKTQELAEQRRGLEEMSNNLRQQTQASQEEMQSRATLVALDTALEHFAQTNWDQFMSQDPIEANRQWMRYQQLKEQRGQIANDLQQRHFQRTHEAKQDTAKRFAETQEFAKKNIKGWSPELETQVLEFARSQGATDDNIRDAMSPMVFKLLYLARIGNESLSKATTVPKVPAAQPAKPLSTVGGKSNPGSGKSIADMDMDEYVAHRQAQMAKGR